jgi:hypothetical protein
MSPVIALMTDFGTTDIYVGVMKGVIQNICPQAKIIDVTHAIAPQNIQHGAFTLLNAYRYFPPGTIFVVVVDPGVGSDRRLVAVQAGGYTFVAPDNGVLSYALAELGDARAVELTNSAYRLPHVSATFHGRDIFAPAAAYLAGGVNFDDLGTPIAQLRVFLSPDLVIEDGTISGEVLHVDHFGNIVTSVGKLEWVSNRYLELRPCFGDQKHQVLKIDRAEVTVNERTFDGIVGIYAETKPGDWLAMVGSSGFLELAINQGNCASRLGTLIGDPVKIRIK